MQSIARQPCECILVISLFWHANIPLVAQAAAAPPAEQQPAPAALPKAPPAPETPPASKAPTTPQAGTAAKNAFKDYIPCLFSKDQAYQFRLQQPPTTITDEAADRMKTALKTTVDSLAKNDPGLDSNAADGIKAKINVAQFSGIASADAADTVRKQVTDATKDVAVSPQTLKNTQNALVKAGLAEVNNSFGPPPDVGCAISFLTYREASDIFGVRIAGTYIVVQLIVRNLNDSQEFLVQDVELAVDTGLHGEFSNFESGRDKQLARAIAVRNEFSDPRNVGLRILEGVGTLGAAAVGFGSSNFGKGVGLWNGGLIPAYKQVFPDYTIDQLNRLNDAGFSANPNSRTVVPKGGTAEFVTFIPSRPLEQVWWVQPCAQKTLELDPNACDSNGRRIGSQNNPKNPQPNGQNNSTNLHHLATVGYKKWSPAALLELKKQSFVIVAGNHIVATEGTEPSVSKIDCGGTSGGVDYTKITNDQISCTITGKNLSQIGAVRLTNNEEGTDLVHADGKVTTSGNATSATATFSAADIEQLKGVSYQLNWINDSGVESPLGAHLNFNPTIKEVDAPTSNAGNDSYPVKGTQLFNVYKVCLTTQAGAVGPQIDLTGVSSNGTSATAIFADADITKEAGKTLNIGIGSMGGTCTPTQATIPAPKAAAPAPPAPKPKKPKK